MLFRSIASLYIVNQIECPEFRQLCMSHIFKAEAVGKKKGKKTIIVIAASDGDKVSQWVPAATAVPVSQLPIVNPVTIPTTASAGVYSMLYTKTGNSMSSSLTNGESILQKPSQLRQVNNVKKILKRSADENSYTFETPLLKASYYGHINVVKELLERDAVDVNVCDKDKCSPLFWAIHEGHELVVTELLQHSAIVNDRNDNGVTPLWMASQQGNAYIVKQLLQHSADVNICDNDGQLPLHFARKNGHSDVELLLLEKQGNQ